MNEKHFVEISDVDTQLQRAGGYDGRELSGFELLFHHQTDLFGQRPVVGIGELDILLFVYQAGQFFRVPAGIRKDEGRTVPSDSTLNLLYQIVPKCFAG